MARRRNPAGPRIRVQRGSSGIGYFVTSEGFPVSGIYPKAQAEKIARDLAHDLAGHVTHIENRRPTLTDALARAAATDAGNASMRAGRRSKWSAADYRAAVAEYDRLMPIPNPRHRANHHLAGAQVLSRAVESLAYVHAADGKPYRHDFDQGVTALLLRDGRVELTRTDGKPLWEDT